MPLKDYIEVTLVTGMEFHESLYGYTKKTMGDGTVTVKIPSHMQKLFRDYGVIV